MRSKGYIIIGILLLFHFPIRSGNVQVDEYILKAGFLEKFARFCEWPEGIIKDEFYLAVVGDNPFEGALKEMYSSLPIKGRPVRIYNQATQQEIANCHLLFIGKVSRERLLRIMADIVNKPILTVSENSVYRDLGVMINFYNTEQGTIHFEMNRDKINQGGLKMNSYLLNYARKSR